MTRRQEMADSESELFPKLRPSLSGPSSVIRFLRPSVHTLKSFTRRTSTPPSFSSFSPHHPPPLLHGAPQ